MVWPSRSGAIAAAAARAGERPRTVGPVLALVLVALSLGLSNFAAAIGIGVVGTDARTRVRVGVVFGIFEAGMPVLGWAGDSAYARGHALNCSAAWSSSEWA